MKSKRAKSMVSAFSVFKKTHAKIHKKKVCVKKPKVFSKAIPATSVSNPSPKRGKKRTIKNGQSEDASICIPSPIHEKKHIMKNGQTADSNCSPSPKRKQTRTMKNDQPEANTSTPVTQFPSKRKSIVPCGNEESDKCLSWLISPILQEDFFTDFWEKKPLNIKQRGEFFYSGIFSCKDFDKILRNNHLEFNTNLDIVSYRNGQRETHNPDGRAYAAVVWDYYQNGHSVRLLNPQTYSKAVWKLCSLLQEYFGSFVGANMYLTPPGSQGFAPHYDDIEAFVLQIEGRKQWKVYAPRVTTEELPRESSKNFTQDEIGDPILEVELEPGDLLYFPRGFIHQAKTSEAAHSLHLTLSTYQKNTYGDLLQKILPLALEKAMEENIAYRDSLSKDYMNFTENSNSNTYEEHTFVTKLVQLTKGLVKYLPPFTGADMMAKEFIHTSLPPCITAIEKDCSIHGNGEAWNDGKVCNAVELKPDSRIALIRKRAVRMVREEGQLRLYHSFENSRIFKEREAQYVDISWNLLSGIEKLLETHPNFIAIEELPLRNLEEQMDLASLLYDKGILRTEVPLSDDSEEETDD